MSRLMTNIGWGLLLSLIACGPSPFFLDQFHEDAFLVETEDPAYQFQPSGTSEAFRLNLTYRLSNHSSLPVRVTSCAAQPYYETKTSDGWIVVKGPECLDGGDEGVLLLPGHTYRGSSNPYLDANGVGWVTGTYRIRLEGVRVSGTERPPVPGELMISNPFEIVRP